MYNTSTYADILNKQDDLGRVLRGDELQEFYTDTDFGINTDPFMGSNQFMGSTGSSFLDAISGKTGMSYLGSLLGGVTGLYAMNLSNRQQKDTAATNSLYRRIMNDEHNRTNKFRSDMSKLSFG